MENYRLTQTGEEVQSILNGAAMQTDLTAENERAEGAEQTLQGNIDDEERRAKAAEETLSGAIGDEELRAKAAEEALGGAIDGINAKIPAAASSENKLADQDFVNSSIETATATFRGTYNLVSDLHLAVDATHAQIATLLGTVIAEADNNDYSYVLVPTSASTPTEIASIEKYTFGANGWAFAYALNNSGFTSAQWAAINSGITSGLVAKLNALPTNTDLLALLAGKQDVLTFDDVPVEGSNNPVKSGGVHSAIDDEKTARVNAVNGVAGRVDTIEGEIPAQASSENQLADKAYVNSSISTNTATYRGSFNLVADLGLSVSATHEQIGTALAGEIATADNNDYAYVQVPTSDETPSQILKVERYKFHGTAWAFEYELNNSGFTSAQWAALNSGITSGLVGKLNALPTNDELTLALAGKQDVLTFDNTPTENSNNPVKSGGVYAADKAMSDAIEAILLLIPSAATSLNKLVDTDLMNSSISTATATFRGTFNLVSDLSLDLTATHAQIATALAGAIATADNNDYCFVQIPTSVGTPTEIAQTDRYKFNGTAWAYEYTLNTSGFTSAQWAAINSGITAALVASLADIPDLIPSEATSANQLADKAYVLAQILAATPAFKGQFVTLAELQAVASPKAGDLGIVRTKDSDGMDVFTVYQYLNNAWNVFYSLSYHPQTKPATTGTTGDYPYNGMGRVELAKNMVNTGTELAPVMVNQLTQDMFYKGAVGSRVPNTNTIFVIRYDYVLAENITIPDNCVLEFEGGSISGSYTLTGANTGIKAGLVKIFATDITITGMWNVAEACPQWFGAKGDGTTNDTAAIKKCIDTFNTIKIPKGNYIVTGQTYDSTYEYSLVDGLLINRSNITIIFEKGAKFTKATHSEEGKNWFIICVSGSANNNRIENITIIGGELIGDRASYAANTDEENASAIRCTNANNVVIKDCIITDNQGGAVTFYECDNITIDNVVCKRNARGAIEIASTVKGLITNSFFADNGGDVVYNGVTHSYKLPGFQICLENDAHQDITSKDIIVENNLIILDNCVGGIQVASGYGVDGIHIKNNTLKYINATTTCLSPVILVGGSNYINNVAVESNIYVNDLTVRSGSEYVHFCSLGGKVTNVLIANNLVKDACVARIAGSDDTDYAESHISGNITIAGNHVTYRELVEYYYPVVNKLVIENNTLVGETFIKTTNIGGNLTERKRIIELILSNNNVLYDGISYNVDGEPVFGNSILYDKAYVVNNNISTIRKNLFQHAPTDTAEFTIQGNVIELLAEYHEINRYTFKPVNALICDNIIRTPNISDDYIPFLKMRADASFTGKARIINNIFEGKVGSLVESGVSESYIINQGNVDLT